jgi:hypothetical protein
MMVEIDGIRVGNFCRLVTGAFRLAEFNLLKFKQFLPNPAKQSFVHDFCTELEVHVPYRALDIAVCWIRWINCIE